MSRAGLFLLFSAVLCMIPNGASAQQGSPSVLATIAPNR